MKLLARTLALTAILAALCASGAGADEGFGLKELGLSFTNPDDSPARQAGSHPFQVQTTIKVNTIVDPDKGEIPIDNVRDLITKLPPGFVGDPYATERCSGADFVTIFDSVPACSNSSVIGVVDSKVGYTEPETFLASLYNLEPPPGVAAKLGFVVPGGVPVTLEVGVNPDPPYNVVVSATKIAQPLRFYGAELTVWGNPASSDHDAERGTCIPEGGCPAGIPNRPFLTLPRSCPGAPLLTRIEVDSWQNPGAWLPPYILESPGMIGCAVLGFEPRISTQPSTDQADSPSGLDVSLDVDDPGLSSPDGKAQSDIKKAVLTLPQGVTANPSLAEGLAACSESDLADETVFSQPGDGCPQASNVGRVEVETPILEGKVLKGQLFIASQNENPFGSLLALYMVIKDPGLGVLVKLAGKIDPDPKTGQLVTTFGEAPYELPQFPLSHVRVHLREGGRSPLVTPPGCGTYTTKAEFTPWANPAKTLTTTSSFQISRGPGGGPCPPPGTPPFVPGFTAGSLNNAAGSHTPFYMRLTRRDGDQDLTRFDATLPPGLVAKLAGTTQCPDAQIDAAKAKNGRAELAAPSCPPSSEIGNVWGGAGAGSQLTYVPGKIYLAGPVGGAPLSVVGIVPAVAGPFDVGTIVVRQALQVDPRTAEVRIDGSVSDPIPHILAGIPLRVRDIRVNVDRPKFTLNPTSCKPLAIDAALWGGGADPFSIGDDAPVSRSERFQAADCAGLGFKPRLSLRLDGGVKRGENPALHSVYKPRRGDANLAALVLRLPRSAFLDQSHIRTICTRVQFAADACPAGAVYGRARAVTPLLEKPLKGPIYLRSSNHNLPDLVFDLHGLVDFEAVFRIDSKKGGIRATLVNAPDAPITKAVVDMYGGDKGLIINSRNLCAKESRANAGLTAHNGRKRNRRPVVQAADCGGKQHKRKAQR
jgi:hypothetical protein